MKERFCENCGSKILENAEFCGNCGSKLPKTNVESNDQGTGGEFDNENRFPGLENSVGSDVPGSAGYAQTIQPAPKKKHSRMIIGIAAALLFVFGCIVENLEKDSKSDEYKKSEAIEKIRDDITSDIDLDKEISDDITPDIDLDKEIMYVKGSTVGTEYTSFFIGVQYNAPDGWVFKSEDELAQMSADPKLTWEMQSINVLNGSNVAVGVQKLPLDSITESVWIDSLKDFMKNSGLAVSDIQETEMKTIAGKEYYAQTYSVTSEGVNYTQAICVRKIGKYMVSFLATSTSPETDIDEILSGFGKYPDVNY